MVPIVMAPDHSEGLARWVGKACDLTPFAPVGKSPPVEKSEEPAPEPISARSRADRRATGVVVAVFLAVSALFIVDSTWELAKGAFAIGGREPLGESAEALACYERVRGLGDRVDHAVVEASKAPIDDAQATFASALGESFSDERLRDVETACQKVPRGPAAFAAVLRVRRAEETEILKRSVEVSPARGDLSRALAK